MPHAAYALKSQKKFKTRKGRFFWNFFLWLLEIPINVVPIFLKQISCIDAGNFSGIGTLFLMTISDFEILFICVGVLFVIIIESCAIDQDVPLWCRRVFAISFIAFCSFLVLYCVFFFRQDLLSLLIGERRAIYNTVSIAVTIIFGVFFNIGISMEEV